MPVRLSIGSAIYNIDEAYLRMHIESITDQLTDETELLLIDDCSTNNSAEICKEYAASNEHVRYIKMEKNGGLSRVRNRTISEAAGNWIFFADGDDIFSSNAVEAALRLCNDKYDIILHDREIFRGEKKAEETPCTVSELKELPPNAGKDISVSCLCSNMLDPYAYGMCRDTYYHAAWGALYRREFLIENAIEFPPGQKKAQDSVFNTYAYYYAKKIAYLSYKMYYYRKDMQGITERYNPDYIETSLSLIKHHEKCIETLYPNDESVSEKYKNNRLIACVVDNMRLNVFHKDNPGSYKERKAALFSFLDMEPFKSAISGYDWKHAWWWWRIPTRLAKKKNFFLLEMYFKHGRPFRVYGRIRERLLQKRTA